MGYERIRPTPARIANPHWRRGHSDAKELQAAGVARVYTPKDYEIQNVMGDLVDIAGGYERAA